MVQLQKTYGGDESVAVALDELSNFAIATAQTHVKDTKVLVLESLLLEAVTHRSQWRQQKVEERHRHAEELYSEQRHGHHRRRHPTSNHGEGQCCERVRPSINATWDLPGSNQPAGL